MAQAQLLQNMRPQCCPARCSSMISTLVAPRLTCSQDAFQARSPDELSLTRGDRIELIERDDDFGDGWYLGKNTESGESGLFPEGTSLLL